VAETVTVYRTWVNLDRPSDVKGVWSGHGLQVEKCSQLTSTFLDHDVQAGGVVNSEVRWIHEDQRVHVFVRHDRLTENGVEARGQVDFRPALLSVGSHFCVSVGALLYCVVVNLPEDNIDISKLVWTKFGGKPLKDGLSCCLLISGTDDSLRIAAMAKRDMVIDCNAVDRTTCSTANSSLVGRAQELTQ